MGGDVGNPARPTEVWNGTNWTEVSESNLPRNRAAGAGANNTSGLLFGGALASTGNITASTEEFSSGPATVTFGTS